jgi:hypothetical protein
MQLSIVANQKKHESPIIPECPQHTCGEDTSASKSSIEEDYETSRLGV